MGYFIKIFRLFCLSWVAVAMILAGSAALQAGKTADTDQTPIQKTAAKDQPEVFYPETQYEFEPVMEGGEIKHDFIIENHGRVPLIIKNVRPD
jgi:hypothetical protein